jgi:hypothetical protein
MILRILVFFMISSFAVVFYEYNLAHPRLSATKKAARKQPLEFICSFCGDSYADVFSAYA